MKVLIQREARGQALCAILHACGPGRLRLAGKDARVEPGQRCPRCAPAPDAAIPVDIPKAA
jgi:hypothetical protein